MAIINRIDQIYALVESVGDVEKLHALFSDTFQLPVTWPPMSHGSFFGGGVYTGNTWFKFITSNPHSPAISDKPARFTYLMFEPLPYAQTMTPLDNRGIPYTINPPNTLQDASGEERIWVRSITLDWFSPGDLDFLLCWYTPTAFSMTTTPTAANMSQHWAIMRDRLNERKGGHLGIQYVKEVIIGVTDFEKCQQQWQILLNPIPPIDDGLWKIGDGPNLRIVPASVDSIQSIVMKVNSLAQARKYLAAHDMLGKVTDHSVWLRESTCYHLDIQLVE